MNDLIGAGSQQATALTAIAVDGKEARGAKVHLASTVTQGTATELERLSVPEESNEIPAFSIMLNASKTRGHG